jgi:glycosyltransferase involved in cell wall biosynthesis
VNTLAIVAGLSKSGGGMSYSVPSWSNALALEKIQRTLITLQYIGEETSDYVDQNLVKLITVPSVKLPLFDIHWSSHFQKILYQFCQQTGVELIHSHGIWLPSNHYAVVVAKKLKIPLIATPHGMLTEWSFHYKWLKKRLAWWIYQKNDLNQARVVHLTSIDEEKDLRRLGFKGTTAVIPNGVEIPSWREETPIEKPYRTALFVSRIHPKKGLLNLVEAWKQVQPKGWKMRLVGPDEGGHLAEVQKTVREKGLEPDFIFSGPLYGNALWEAYWQSDLFILPTMNENFGNVVPEALACGVPVITTHGTPWEELDTHSCGWWIPVGVAPLAEALRKATELSDAQRREMGKRGRKLVEEKYTWHSVGKQMKTLYEWVLGGGPKPPFLLSR